MGNRNLILFTFFLLIIFSSCATGLKCCKTKNDVKVLLSGLWKETNSKRKSLDKYSFSQKKGFYEELQLINNEEYLIIDDHTIFEIIQDKRNFKIKFINLLETWISDIKYLDKQKLVLVTKGQEKEFYRSNE